MNTKNWTRHLAWGVLGLVTQQAYSQATQDDNNGGFLSFLGWNAGANQILQVKNEANQPIEWWTGDIRRMLMNPNSSYTIGSFALQPKPGAVLLSPNVDQFFANTGPGPYSMLHLAAADNNAQQASYREWMDVGVTFTGNADHGYVGQKVAKETILDFTDMVIHWSDNPSKFLKDRMRFIFTSGYNASDDTGASSEEGLEGMRLFPVDNDNVNVGIQPSVGSLAEDPALRTRLCMLLKSEIFIAWYQTHSSVLTFMA